MTTTTTTKRSASEIVRLLMTGFRFEVSPEAEDLTLGECLELYRELLLQESAGTAGKK